MIIEATLDFHNFGKLTREQASLFLENFLEESYIEKFSKVLVITGKGNNGENSGKRILREHIRAELRKSKLVKSFHTADSWNGGAGAFEVLLKDC